MTCIGLLHTALQYLHKMHTYAYICACNLYRGTNSGSLADEGADEDDVLVSASVGWSLQVRLTYVQHVCECHSSCRCDHASVSAVLCWCKRLYVCLTLYVFIYIHIYTRTHTCTPTLCMRNSTPCSCGGKFMFLYVCMYVYAYILHV